MCPRRRGETSDAFREEVGSKGGREEQPSRRSRGLGSVCIRELSYMVVDVLESAHNSLQELNVKFLGTFQTG